MTRHIFVDFESGTDGQHLNTSNCPGLNGGNGFYIAQPHTGMMAATFDDAYANTGAGVLTGIVPTGVDGGSPAGFVGGFAKFAAGSGDTIQTVACQCKPIGGPGFFEIVADFTVAAADPDYPGQPFVRLSDLYGVTITKVPIGFGLWYELRVGRNGDWSFRDASGAPLASGNLGFVGNDTFNLLINAGTTVTPARLVVDDYYWMPKTPKTPPVIRKWPRDDGLGYSSAARIHPPPKSGRIVGGYQ